MARGSYSRPLQLMATVLLLTADLKAVLGRFDY